MYEKSFYLTAFTSAQRFSCLPLATQWVVLTNTATAKASLWLTDTQKHTERESTVTVNTQMLCVPLMCILSQMVMLTSSKWQRQHTAKNESVCLCVWERGMCARRLVPIQRRIFWATSLCVVCSSYTWSLIWQFSSSIVVKLCSLSTGIHSASRFPFVGIQS